MESSIKTRPEAIHFGELVNVVPFPDHWFGAICSIYFLLLFVDHATGEVTHSEIVSQPGIYDYGFAFWKYLMAYGKPKSFRTDRSSIFKRNLIKKARSFKLDDVLNIISVRHCYDSSVYLAGVVVQAISGLRSSLIDGLRQREVWQVRAALSLHLARTEFDPRKIQSELAETMIRGTERRAA